MFRLRKLYLGRLVALAVMTAGLTGPALAEARPDERKVQRLIDHQDIERLINDYSWYLDAKDFEAYGALFSHGVVLNASGTVIASGAAQVGETAKAYLGHDNGKFVRHVVSNVRIDIGADGNQASATSFLTTIEGEQGGPGYVFRIARYHDRFVRIEGEWHFHTRQELTDWVLRERVPNDAGRQGPAGGRN